jgi:exodeoxyribonuclease VII large subunit
VASDRTPLTVTDLTLLVKDLLEEEFRDVWVVGEIGNLTRARSGHVYLTLKDEGAALSAVMWRSVAERLRFELEEGQELLVRGRLNVYPPRGTYQLDIRMAEPRGLGALQAAFEKLKAKLAAEGLFDPGRKRPLPFLPAVVGVVTSPTGAAVRDILTVLARRLPRLTVLLWPARVQGEGAAEEVARGIEGLNRRGGVDVLIVGRGGGSLEDLFAFNEERVARAIAESRIPVVSAVGHEVDFTIADFVADVRAPTPSAAAEIVVPSERELRAMLRSFRARLDGVARAVLDARRERVRALEGAFGLRRLPDRLRMFAQRLDEQSRALRRLATDRIAAARQRVVALAARAEGLSPLRVLARGYSLTTLDGAVLTSPEGVPAGALIRTRLAKGTLDSRVEGGTVDGG